MKYPYRSNRAGQQGSVIIEALIAILIFSIGILGMIQMQAVSVNHVSDAKYRVDASFLANQIIGAMWANRASLATYACNPCTSVNGNADTQTWVMDVGVETASGFTPALPNPTANISIAGNMATVSLTWRPPQVTTAHSYTAIAQID